GGGRGGADRARGPDGDRPLEPPGGPAPEGFRRLHPRGVRGGPAAHDRPPTPRRAAALPPAASVPQAGGPPRSPPHRPALAALRRRAHPPGLHRGGAAAPPDRADLRRVGLDGALLPGAAPVPPRRRRRTGPDRGLRPRLPADPDHPGALVPG